jgi:hypothetical protein
MSSPDKRKKQNLDEDIDGSISFTEPARNMIRLEGEIEVQQLRYSPEKLRWV